MNYFCTADEQFRVGRRLLNGISVEADYEEAHNILQRLALIDFYKRRNTDNFVSGLIEYVKRHIAEAQGRLDRETSNYQL